MSYLTQDISSLKLVGNIPFSSNKNTLTMQQIYDDKQFQQQSDRRLLKQDDIIKFNKQQNQSKSMQI